MLYLTDAQAAELSAIADHEIYSFPVFQNNTMAAYALALYDLAFYAADDVRVGSAVVAQNHGVNQQRLLDLNQLLGKHI
jgi:hypothetical protein